MSNGRSGTIKSGFFIVLSVLLVGGALAYRLIPDAKERRENAVLARLEPGENITFDATMSVELSQTSIVDGDGDRREFKRCNVLPGAQATILRNSVGYDGGEVILRYLGDQPPGAAKACEYRALIKVPRPAVEAIVRSALKERDDKKK